YELPLGIDDVSPTRTVATLANDFDTSCQSFAVSATKFGAVRWNAGTSGICAFFLGSHRTPLLIRHRSSPNTSEYDAGPMQRLYLGGNGRKTDNSNERTHYTPAESLCCWIW